MSPVLASTSLVELLDQRAAASPGAPGLYSREDDGHWRALSWQEARAASLNGATRLRQYGLKPGDAVAVMARTRREWLLAEQAVMRAGGIVVGVEAHAPAEHVEHVLRHARARAIVLDGDPCLSKIPEDLLAGFTLIVTLDPCSRPAGTLPILTHSEFFQSGEPNGEREAAPPSDAARPATLIYTSGTTGTPKAITFTHGHLLSACQAINRLFPAVTATSRTVCWLPMAHLFQRMLNLVAISKGAPIYFQEDPRALMSALPEIRPSVLIGVPRLFEKIHSSFQDKTNRIPRLLRPLVMPFARRALLRALGGRIDFMLTGSAPCPIRVLDFFRSLGIPLLEAYGISENAIPMAVNHPGAWRPGSVGRPLPENEIRMAEDGEILVRGPGLFSGYHRDDETRDCFTPDGFYQTGDYGLLDGEGFLHLKGRKSDIIKTSTGRRISPARLEELLQACPCFEHAVVVGHGRKHLAALLTLNRYWLARELDVPADRLAPGDWQKASAAQRKVLAEIGKVNAHLPGHEQIHSFSILSHGLSIGSGDLTPTLKVRRKNLQDKHATLIEQLYEPCC